MAHVYRLSRTCELGSAVEADAEVSDQEIDDYLANWRLDGWEVAAVANDPEGHPQLWFLRQPDGACD